MRLAVPTPTAGPAAAAAPAPARAKGTRRGWLLAGAAAAAARHLATSNQSCAVPSGPCEMLPTLLACWLERSLAALNSGHSCSSAARAAVTPAAVASAQPSCAAVMPAGPAAWVGGGGGSSCGLQPSVGWLDSLWLHGADRPMVAARQVPAATGLPQMLLEVPPAQDPTPPPQHSSSQTT